jgi:hypothetical protein
MKWSSTRWQGLQVRELPKRRALRHDAQYDYWGPKAEIKEVILRKVTEDASSNAEFDKLIEEEQSTGDYKKRLRCSALQSRRSLRRGAQHHSTKTYRGDMRMPQSRQRPRSRQ